MATYQAVVLVFKGVGYYRVIGLVEVLLKVVIVIFCRRFTASIAFHGFFHGFRTGYGTGTVSLKAKLPHQLAAMMDEVL